jgi:hypothetical protein
MPTRGVMKARKSVRCGDITGLGTLSVHAFSVQVGKRVPLHAVWVDLKDAAQESTETAFISIREVPATLKAIREIAKAAESLDDPTYTEIPYTTTTGLDFCVFMDVYQTRPKAVIRFRQHHVFFGC